MAQSMCWMVCLMMPIIWFVFSSPQCQRASGISVNDSPLSFYCLWRAVDVWQFWNNNVGEWCKLFAGGPYRVRERRRSRWVVMTVEVTDCGCLSICIDRLLSTTAHEPTCKKISRMMANEIKHGVQRQVKIAVYNDIAESKTRTYTAKYGPYKFSVTPRYFPPSYQRF